MALDTVDFTRPVLDTICLIERLDSEKTRMLAKIEIEMDFMMW